MCWWYWGGFGRTTLHLFNGGFITLTTVIKYYLRIIMLAQGVQALVLYNILRYNPSGLQTHMISGLMCY